MGFMDLSVAGSDEAACAFDEMERAMVRSLKKALKDDANRYNTPGYVNVAMIIEEVVLPSRASYWGAGMVGLAKMAVERLDKEKANWGDEHQVRLASISKKIHRWIDDYEG